MEFVKALAKYVAPMILFVGGVWLLSLRVPFWGLLLGIGATQVGIILIILSFDSSARKTFALDQLHIIRCEICGDPVAVPKGDTKALCADCKLKKT